MSQKVVLAAALAATSVAALDTQGFCLSYKGASICNEQVEAALDSQKINITGCVTINGFQVCKNSEETGLFEEEQGFCVEWKGIKACKEQIEAALESEKIDITGCVKIGKVEICKNQEEQEQGLGKALKKAVKIAKVVGPLVLEEEEDFDEQGKFWKKLGNVAKKIIQNVNVSVAFEEEAEMEEDVEQGKFWKKLGKALKKVVDNVNVSVTLEEEEALATFVSHYKTVKPYFPRILDEEELALVESEENFLTNPNFWKTVGKIVVKVLPIFLEEDEVVVVDEQGFFKKVGKALKKVVNNVDISVALEEEEQGCNMLGCPDASYLDYLKKRNQQPAEDEEQKLKLKKIVKGVVKAAKVAQQVGLLEEETEEEQKIKFGKILKGVTKAAKIAKQVGLLEEEQELEEQKIKLGKIVKGAVKVAKVVAPLVLEEEQEQQGFCVEWKGIKACKEEIEAVLETEKINISGCLTYKGINVCKNSEETGLFEEEQGFCVEWNGIKVCKEEIEAALETEGINVSGCVTIKGAQICLNKEDKEYEAFDEEQMKPHFANQLDKIAKLKEMLKKKQTKQ